MASNHEPQLYSEGVHHFDGSQHGGRIAGDQETESTISETDKADVTSTDKYEVYAALYDPEWESEWSPVAPPRTNRGGLPREKKSHEDIVGELTDEAAGLEAGFRTTYTPARYEEGFLLDAIRHFYDVGLIEDVLANVKGGKEANVYRCRPTRVVGVDYLAAKVYRPRRFRNLRNDKMYREGREVLSATGKTVKANERRTMAAIRKKTGFGVQAAHTSWMMYEFTTMEDLWRAGARVPRPYAVSENAILMGYIGDGGRAAPTLHEIDLDRTEAAMLFDVVMDNVETMMQLGVVHGDLSAYNILYWDGELALIDFPQVTDIHSNPNAAVILQRDLRRVCSYFRSKEVACDPDALAADLWQRYHPTRALDVLADLSRAEDDTLDDIGDET